MIASKQAVRGQECGRIVQASAKWLMAAIVGCAILGASISDASDGDWLDSHPVMRPENVSLLAESGRIKTDPGAPLARKAESGSYDPYTCAAAYGDTFCAEFERCMGAYGFDACYVRFNR